MKEHSQDYLLEFVDSNNIDLWLKGLIYETINTNGNISKEYLDAIYYNFLNGDNITINLPTKVNNENKNVIKYISLNHIKWVNALAANQIIKFSDDITILHGLNWAWKSSYFKIINEISGWHQQKNIMSNIYTWNKENIDVKIKYKDLKGEYEINWDGTTRDLPILNYSRVFDSSYLTGLITERETDTTLIQPFGLHYFEYIITHIDLIKTKLLQDKSTLISNQPLISTDKFTNDIKNIFLNNKINNELKEKLIENFNFTKINDDKLNQINESILTLQKDNIDDKIKIEQRKKDDIEIIRQKLISSFTVLKKKSEEIPTLVKQYNSSLEESLKIKDQIKVLKDIPNSDSLAWKNFIKTWDTFSKHIHDDKQNCIYCHQPLEEKSLEIITSYSLFLNNTSEQNVEKLEQEIRERLKDLNLLIIEFTINNDIIQILESITIWESHSLYKEILSVIDIFINKKREFIQDLTNKTLTSDYNFSLVWTGIKEWLNLIVNNQEKIVKDLLVSKWDKDKKISELLKEQVTLNENKSIYEQQNKISNWLSNCEKINKIEWKEKSLKTHKITSISTQAHNELLTEKLKNIFIEELKWFGLNLDVSLVKARSSKWKISTELLIWNDYSVNSILSEGEQKAVWLSLFISECRMSHIKSPIILDDPINSLDHKIASKFTDRLILLDNQIIIFNHNKLFIDAFKTWKWHHVCDKLNNKWCSKQWKHTRIYDVISQWINLKGILKLHKENNLKSNLEEVTKLLEAIPFNEDEKVATLLRISIECYIDEKILNNQIPTRYTSNNINWQWLKTISINHDLIDEIHKIYRRLSWWLLHNSIESMENPIEFEDYQKCINLLQQ